MSGPIVRTGTTPKFWENWDKAFGKGKSSQAAAKKPAAKAKPAKKPAGKGKKA